MRGPTRLRGADWKSIRGGRARSCRPGNRPRRPALPAPPHLLQGSPRQGGGHRAPQRGVRELPLPRLLHSPLLLTPTVWSEKAEARSVWEPEGPEGPEGPFPPSSIVSLGAGRVGGSQPPPAGSEPAWTDGSPAAPLAGSCPGGGRSGSGPGLHAQGSEGEDAIRPQRLRSRRAHAQQTVAPHSGGHLQAHGLCTPGFRGSGPGMGQGRADPHPVPGGPLRQETGSSCGSRGRGGHEAVRPLTPTRPSPSRPR